MCLLDNCQISSMSDKYPTAFKVAYYHKGFQQNKIFIQVRWVICSYTNKTRSDRDKIAIKKRMKVKNVSTGQKTASG